mmetsp:Transcript_36258/g.47635  ORF Transcript_36258/g.47635 Transcript_36258/m.47635 type:complete len:117 (+) Transcript_36258:905-1255(+)
MRLDLATFQFFEVLSEFGELLPRGDTIVAHTLLVAALSVGVELTGIERLIADHVELDWLSLATDGTQELVSCQQLFLETLYGVGLLGLCHHDHAAQAISVVRRDHPNEAPCEELVQ